MNEAKVDYDPTKRRLKDRVRWRIPEYVSRFVPQRKKWTYITLGGEDLYDVRRLLTGLKRGKYPHEIISAYFEPDDTPQSAQATITSAELAANDIQLTWHLRLPPQIIRGTVASLRAGNITSDLVVMFLDYEGTVLKFRHEIGSCVANSVLGVHDLLFVTSCVDEKFFEGNHRFRREAQTKVAEFLRVPFEQVISEDVLRFHDLNVIRDQVRAASFNLKDKLDCVPVGPLLLYQDTVRMLWLPLRIVSQRKNPVPNVELETLRR